MRARCFLLLAAVSLAGCGRWFHSGVHAPHAALDDATQIDADDGSFHLVSGQEAPTPFVSKGCPIRPVIADWRAALANEGARKVHVTYPNAPPLFGVLAFCGVPDGDPSSRLYDLRIPRSYVDATDAGRISLVFERTSSGRPAWVLWLSREPF